MEATLRDGDEILVDRTPRPLRDGIHVVRVGDLLLVKRLDTGRPGMLALVSDNPAYRTIALPPEEVELVGRVVWANWDRADCRSLPKCAPQSATARHA